MNVGKKALCGVIAFCLFVQGQCGGNTVIAKTKAIKLNMTKKTITVGGSFRLKLKGKRSPKTVVTWKSSNKKIAIVSKTGKVTGKKAGKAKITVKVSGKSRKLTCQVTVQKKKAASSAKPVKTPVPDPTDVSSSAPGAAKTPEVTQTSTPVITETPAASPKQADPSTLVVSQSLVMHDGILMTAYLINKNYNGYIMVSLNGKSYAYGDEISGRTLLMMLDRSYTNRPKVNQEGTISLSRGENDEYWTVTDLVLNKEYYLKADRTNSLDPSWADCGVIYVKGDVSAEMGFQTNIQ